MTEVSYTFVLIRDIRWETFISGSISNSPVFHEAHLEY
jgi:hypothetical protein